MSKDDKHPTENINPEQPVVDRISDILAEEEQTDFKGLGHVLAEKVGDRIASKSFDTANMSEQLKAKYGPGSMSDDPEPEFDGGLPHGGLADMDQERVEEQMMRLSHFLKKNAAYYALATGVTLQIAFDIYSVVKIAKRLRK